MAIQGKVLVIDDEPSIHKLIAFILEEEGFVVLSHEAHEEAKRLVDRGRPDVIILDIFMPEVDGFDILKMLKSDEETSHIPVIILSVSNMQLDKEKASSLGAYRYLTKPFEPARLVEAVKDALNGLRVG
jgi:CheY-like chemotaxis protein